ncbi:MAG: PVC-type heme-binding CxxCH protein [Planctomycetales bacterium]
MSRTWLRVAGVFLTGLAFLPGTVSAQSPAAEPPATFKSPLSPEESLIHLQLAAGFRIEIAAAEPEVIDPVSMAFDADGRMYVVEMRDYPNGPQPGEPPLSRIKLLEDLDRDGRFETAHLFAEQLLFATGVQPWNGGVIVTLAGEIAYFKDTDGDHRADLRETWFRGFAQDNPQLRANHPTFAIDNHIYVSNGLKGGTVQANSQKWGQEFPPVPISGKDFRFDPLTGACEAVAGNGQFGMAIDDQGRRFICDNRHPCKQVMLEDRYTRRNPFLAVRDVVQDVCAAAEFSRVYPLSQAWTTSTLHAGQFTAACGVQLDQSGVFSFPERGRTILVCEPTGNLVHREVTYFGGTNTKASSATAFVGRPVDTEREFLATPDTWFRPVDLADGPDGALYVVDMYRAVIEHPEWVPVELKNRPDTWLGNDRGRIYRIVATHANRLAIEPSPPLGGLASADLIPLLTQGYLWQRDTASRLLYERQDKSIVPELQRLAKEKGDSQSRNVWVLEGLGTLSDEMVLDRMGGFDSSAWLWAEPRLKRLLADASTVERTQGLLFAGQQGLTAVSMQHILTVGEAPDSEPKLRFLARAGLLSGGDEWMRRALLTSAGDQPAALFGEIISQLLFGQLNSTDDHALLVRDLAEVIGARREVHEVGPALAALVTFREQDRRRVKQPAQRLMLAGWNGLGQGLARRGDSLPAMLARLNEREEGVREGLKPLFQDAVLLAQSEAAPAELRLEAIAALQFIEFDLAGEALLKLATTDPDQVIRLRVIDVLASYGDPRIADTLLGSFAAATPTVRRALLQALLRHGERTKRLLAEIAAGRMAATDLDPLTVQALLKHADQGTRDQAQTLLASLVPAERSQVLAQYQSALALKADARRGKAIFEKHCTACHKIDKAGVDVAPDIADSRTKTPAQLLTDILSPNQAIDNNYVSYTVVTADGKSETGVLSAETPSSITLRQPEGKTLRLLRQDIEELRSNGVSLMPEGLEKNISLEQMADLISYIKNWRYLDGAVPLGDGSPADK